MRRDERTSAVIHRDEERTEAENRAKLAAAKMLSTMEIGETYKIRLDKGLYGAALLIPQLARSAGYPKNLLILCLRSYIFLVVNYVCQVLVLYMIAKEELIWDAFAGQMFLCDFGRNAGDCPNGPDCVGPGGTIYEPARVYSWGIWSTRVFETSAIDDIVVNSVALAFILQIDELLCSELMSDTTKTLLEMVEDYELQGFEEANRVEDMRDEDVLQEYESHLDTHWSFLEIIFLIPYKLVVVLLFTVLFVEMYYFTHCIKSEDGGWVSREMRYPLSTHFSFLCAFFSPFLKPPTENEPFWQMPAPHPP